MMRALARAAVNLRGMMAFTLRFEEELRNAAEYFNDLKESKIGFA
jgi:non-homologous end joining protein Ku